MANPRKVLLSVARAGAIALVFVIASVGALLSHLNLPRGRRAVAAVLTTTLDRALGGKFQIGRVESLTPQRIVVGDVLVMDPEGRVVIKASRLAATADIPGILRALLSGEQKLTIEIERTEIARAEFHWYGDPSSGRPSVVRAFLPRPTPPAASSAGPAREVRVAIREVELARGYARGAPAGLPTLELELSKVKGYVLATSNGAEVAFSRFGVVARGLGGADARGVASVRVRAPGYVFTAFDGYFGEVQIGSVVRADGEHLRATLDLPRARPAELRALLPSLPLAEDLSAEVELEGELPTLQVNARLAAGRTRAVGSGAVHLADKLRAELEVSALSLDLAAFRADFPKSELNASGTVLARSTSTGLSLELKAQSEPGRLWALDVPAAELAASLENGLLTGSALLREPGLPVRATFAARPDGTIDISAQSARVHLDAPRLRPLGLGRGQGDVRLVAHVKEGRVSADVVASVDDYERNGIHLSRATVSGRARGPLARPEALELDAKLEADQASAEGLVFQHVRGKIQGSASKPRLHLSLEDMRGTAFESEASLIPKPGGARIEDLKVLVRKDQTELKGGAAALDFSNGALELSGVELSGLGGTAKGTVRVSERQVAIDAKGEKLDLGRLARFLGLPSHVVSGALDFEADVLLARDIERGTLHLTLREGNVGPLPDVTSSLHARLENHRLEGDAEGDVKGLFKAAARFNVTIPGSVRDQKALSSALGDVEIDVTDVDLGHLSGVVAPGSEPPISGKLALVLKATRSVPYALPSLSLNGYTAGLELKTSEVIAGGPRVSGVDARFGANVSGETGEADVSLKLIDRRGALASASLTTTVDLVQALKNPGNLGRQLVETATSGKLLLEDRAFAELPPSLQPTGASGRVRAEVALTGTLSAPTISGRLRLAELEWATGQTASALDLCSSFGWEHNARKLGSRGEIFQSNPRHAPCEGRRVGQYALSGSLLPASSGPQKVEGNAVLSLEGAPLDAIPQLAAADVKGRVSGTISLAQTGEVPSLSANLSLANTSIQDVSVGDGKLELRSNEKAVGVTLELTKGNGHIQGTALAAVDYRGTLPRFMAGEPIGIRIAAQRADAVVLAPFTRDLLSEVGGEVDANITFALSAPDGVETAKPGRLSGKVEGDFALHQGTLELAGLGLRLHEVELVARAQSEGDETRIAFGTLRARAGRQRQAVGVRNGNVWLRGLELTRAEGAIDATELPLVVEGVPLATATTRQSIAFKAQRGEKAILAHLDVPYLVVALPQTAGRELISLEENRRFEIAQPIGEPRRRSEGGLPWRFSFTLGQNVKLTRSDLDLPLSGQAELELGDDLGVGGDLELSPGGRVTVSSKTFVIESGEVHFDTGDPADPRIRVTANWRAPDSSLVTVEVTGTLKRADLRLSSPGRDLTEIYALLLGGGGEGTDAGAASAGVGADRLLGPLLENTPFRSVELRTGSERTADERTYSTYTAAVPIGEALWFEGSYKSLTSANGSDQAGASDASNAWSGTVDWRFKRNWSLRTEIGTIGAGMDLVWTHRY